MTNTSIWWKKKVCPSMTDITHHSFRKDSFIKYKQEMSSVRKQYPWKKKILRNKNDMNFLLFQKFLNKILDIYLISKISFLMFSTMKSDGLLHVHVNKSFWHIHHLYHHIITSMWYILTSPSINDNIYVRVMDRTQPSSHYFCLKIFLWNLRVTLTL